MSSFIIGLFSAGSIFAGALLGIGLQRALPGNHLSKEMQDLVKLSAGTIAALTALVAWTAGQFRQKFVRRHQHRNSSRQREVYSPGSDSGSLWARDESSVGTIEALAGRQYRIDLAYGEDRRLGVDCLRARQGR